MHIGQLFALKEFWRRDEQLTLQKPTYLCVSEMPLDFVYLAFSQSVRFQSKSIDSHRRL